MSRYFITRTYPNDVYTYNILLILLPFIHTDTDECTLGTHDCANVAACQNTRGSYICVCPAGYFGDGRVCTGMLDQKHFLVYTQHRQHGTKIAVRFLLFGGHVVSK